MPHVQRFEDVALDELSGGNASSQGLPRTLADEWEERHGGTARFGSGTNNWDGDGMTDWEEYVADTQPTNPASCFAIHGVSSAPPCALTFSSSVARVYSLSACGDLPGGGWQGVAGLTNRPGTGAVMCLTDTNQAALRLYRLGVALP